MDNKKRLNFKHKKEFSATKFSIKQKRVSSDSQQTSAFFSSSTQLPTTSTDSDSDFNSESSESDNKSPQISHPGLQTQKKLPEFTMNPSSDEENSTSNDSADNSESSEHLADQSAEDHTIKTTTLDDFLDLEPASKSSRPKDTTSTKVLLTGLSWLAPEDEIKDFCSTFGKIKLALSHSLMLLNRLYF